MEFLKFFLIFFFIIQTANIKQDRTLRSKISPKETNFIKSKTGFFAKSAV